MSTYDQHLDEPRQLEHHDRDPDERQEPSEPKLLQCLWTDDEWGFWRTECGQSFAFESDGLKEHKFRFCYYCGRPIVTDPTGGEHQAPESFTGEIVQAGNDECGQPRAIIHTTVEQLMNLPRNFVGAKVRVTIQP